MSSPSGELLQGTLAMLILKALLPGHPLHGYGIARWVEAVTGDTLRIEDRGWVTAEWGLSENNRRAKYYAITEAGRAQVRAEGLAWLRHADAVATVLRAAPAIG